MIFWWGGKGGGGVLRRSRASASLFIHSVKEGGIILTAALIDTRDGSIGDQSKCQAGIDCTQSNVT